MSSAIAADGKTRRWGSALLRLAGFAALVLSLVYVWRSLEKLDWARALASLDYADWWAVGGAAAVYGLSLTLLASAWVILAAPSGAFSWRATIAVYAPGVIAKYLPGSVFQYASRQVLGARNGFAQGAMLKASLTEALLHVLVAAVIGGLLLVGTPPLMLLPLAALALLGRSRAASPLIKAVGLQMAFFATLAGSVLVIAALAPAADDPARLAGFFLFAWVAGFVVPVAPGGIGVREAALLAIVGHSETIETVVLVALMARLVNILGDGLFGVAGYLVAVGPGTRSNTQASE